MHLDVSISFRKGTPDFNGLLQEAKDEGNVQVTSAQ